MARTSATEAGRLLLGSRSSGRDNCFDVLRLGAATLVLVSHSFALAGQGEPKIGRSSLGVVGVEIFFAISGFLVTKSWLAEPRARQFLAKRSLRILPALAVTVALSAFVLGPAITSLPTGVYLHRTGPAVYVTDNLAGVVSAGTVRNVAYELPGVFKHNTNSAVNGSLWTLPVEVRAYIVVLLLGLAGLLLRWIWLVAGASLLLLAAPASAASLPGVGPLLRIVRDAQPESLLLLAVFLVSGLMYVMRARVPLRPWLAAAALGAWLGFSWAPFGAPLVAIAIPYVVLFAAYEAPKRLRRLTRHGDVSYGLYLLAFPIQQTIVHLAGADGIGPYALIAIAFPVTYGLATLSWRLVERPALGLKRVVPRAERPAPSLTAGVAAPERPRPAPATP